MKKYILALVLILLVFVVSYFYFQKTKDLDSKSKLDIASIIERSHVPKKEEWKIAEFYRQPFEAEKSLVSLGYKKSTITLDEYIKNGYRICYEGVKTFNVDVMVDINFESLMADLGECLSLTYKNGSNNFSLCESKSLLQEEIKSCNKGFIKGKAKLTFSNVCDRVATPGGGIQGDIVKLEFTDGPNCTD